MIVDKDKFVETMNNVNSFITNLKTERTKTFNEEIVKSVGASDKNAVANIINRLTMELNNFTLSAVSKTKPWYVKFFCFFITELDINLFLLNKKNKLLTIVTDLILEQKNIYKSVLFLEEELKINKNYLRDVVSLRAGLLSQAEILKNSVLDTSSVDEITALELGNRKFNMLKQIQELIETFETTKTVLTQNITGINIGLKQFEKINNSLDLLVNVTIPNWSNLLVTEILNKKVDKKAIFIEVEAVNNNSGLISEVNLTNNLLK